MVLNSFLLNLSSPDPATSNDFTINYSSNPIMLGDAEYEIALTSAQLWYSFFNISSAFNNNIFRYSTDSGGNYKTITIPNGIYGILDLNSVIQSVMEENGDFDNSGTKSAFYITILPNLNTLKIIIAIDNPTYRVDLTVGNLNEILGFNKQILAVTSESENRANIQRDVDSLYIRTNLVSSQASFGNEIGSDILYTFSPNSAPGSILSIQPFQPVFLPLSPKRYIDSVRIYVTDNLNRPVNFNGERCTYTLSIRRIVNK